ncbi:putative GNAT family acetyltransferase [Bradyrhizobium huanghuaihaiense]
MSDVIDNKAHHRFEFEVEGHLATEHYKLDGNVITFEHTEVPKELGGKGVGSKLVQGALDQVRSAGLKLPAMPVREGVDREAPGLSGPGEAITAQARP